MAETVTFVFGGHIVDLDPTGQAFARIPLHHHLHELVFELPGGVLGHTEAAAEFEAGDPCSASGGTWRGTKCAAAPWSRRKSSRRSARSAVGRTSTGRGCGS